MTNKRYSLKYLTYQKNECLKFLNLIIKVMKKLYEIKI